MICKYYLPLLSSLKTLFLLNISYKVCKRTSRCVREKEHYILFEVISHILGRDVAKWKILKIFSCHLVEQFTGVHFLFYSKNIIDERPNFAAVELFLAINRTYQNLGRTSMMLPKRNFSVSFTVTSLVNVSLFSTSFLRRVDLIPEVSIAPESTIHFLAVVSNVSDTQFM